MKRPHRLELQLSDAELDELDAQRGGVVRAVYLRSLISRPHRAEQATHEESVRLLAESARAGSVTAQVALERALRSDRQPQTDDGWLEKLVNGS